MKKKKENSKAGFYDASAYVKKLLKDPEIRFYYEKGKAKEQLAQAVHEARMKAHLSQAQLARKAGTTQSVIARLEGTADPSIPTLPMLQRIARACGGVFRCAIEFKKAA
jgi:ribosome-binding protein aMBF1 (putative translation factor)